MRRPLIRRERSIPNHLKRQSGVALIAMLLVFGLVVILVSGAITRASLDIKKTGYHLQYSQAYQYALGAEALARVLLHNDWQEDQKQKRGDHLKESWAQPFQFEPEGGLMRVQIRDLNGRFNLNTLIDQHGKAVDTSVKHFERLLQQLDMPIQPALSIIDWLDKDNQPRSSRGEDVFYQSSENAYRSADRPMVHASELVALQAFDDADHVQQLRHKITALPEINTSINPNTADRVLLASLHKDIQADDIVQARSELENAFTSNQAFLEHSVTAGIDLSRLNLDVRSHYFEVWVIAQFNDQIAYLRSLVYRAPDTGIITTLYRDQSRNDRYNPLLNLSIHSPSSSSSVSLFKGNP